MREDHEATEVKDISTDTCQLAGFIPRHTKVVVAGIETSVYHIFTIYILVRLLLLFP